MWAKKYKRYNKAAAEQITHEHYARIQHRGTTYPVSAPHAMKKGGADGRRVRTLWALQGAVVTFSVTFSRRSARTQVDDCDLSSVEISSR